MTAGAPEPLPKAVWTDEDFDAMGWHDAAVHAVALREEGGRATLLLDLDYVVRRLPPQPPHGHFRFLVAPATLAFDDVRSFEGDLGLGAESLEIREIRRCLPANGRAGSGRAVSGWGQWTIEGSDFELRFLAQGFRQHFRARPFESGRPRVAPADRGGTSFAQPVSFPG